MSNNRYSERYKCPGCGSNLDHGEKCFDCAKAAEAQKKAAPEVETPKAANGMIAPIFYGAETEKSRGEEM